MGHTICDALSELFKSLTSFRYGFQITVLNEQIIGKLLIKKLIRKNRFKTLFRCLSDALRNGFHNFHSLSNGSTKFVFTLFTLNERLLTMLRDWSCTVLLTLVARCNVRKLKIKFWHPEPFFWQARVVRKSRPKRA